MANLLNGTFSLIREPLILIKGERILSMEH